MQIIYIDLEKRVGGGGLDIKIDLNVIAMEYCNNAGCVISCQDWLFIPTAWMEEGQTHFYPTPFLSISGSPYINHVTIETTTITK